MVTGKEKVSADHEAELSFPQSIHIITLNGSIQK